MSFKIDSQLSENQIEADVSSYLGYITPFWAKRFRLISVDEQLTGADKLFNRFLPIYLQFKVSQGLNPNSTVFQRFRNKPLANIISYRAANNLSGNPILYFSLRRKSKTAKDFQHNILHKLNNPPFQFSLYIAPLTLDILEYEKLLNRGWYIRFYPFDPFTYKEAEIHDTSLRSNIVLGANPFLRHHISIPPHTTILTHDHCYSYSKSGGDLAWHGGKMFNDDFRFSNQLLRIFNYAYNSENFGFRYKDFIDFIDQFNKENDFASYGESNTNNDYASVLSIREFADNLKKKFNIKLILLTQQKPE